MHHREAELPLCQILRETLIVGVLCIVSTALPFIEQGRFKYGNTYLC